jgi:hypothetical protein
LQELKLDALTRFHPTGDVKLEAGEDACSGPSSSHRLSTSSLFDVFMRLLRLPPTEWARLPDPLKEAAISVLGDYVEARVAATTAPTPILPAQQLRWLVNAVQSGLASTDPYLRQTAANVAGVLVVERRVTAAGICPETMQALRAAIEAVSTGAGRRSEDVAAKEAAVVALVRVLKERGDVGFVDRAKVSPTSSILAIIR